MVEKKEKREKEFVKGNEKDIKVLSKPIDIEKVDLYYSCCRKSQHLSQLLY